MSNEHDPSENWTNEQGLELCKLEDAWLDEIQGNSFIEDILAPNSCRSYVELSPVILSDIENRKIIYSYPCQSCEFATDFKDELVEHSVIHETNNHDFMWDQSCVETIDGQRPVELVENGTLILKEARVLIERINVATAMNDIVRQQPKLRQINTSTYDNLSGKVIRSSDQKSRDDENGSDYNERILYNKYNASSYDCDLCGTTYIKRGMLINHIYNSHPGHDKRSFPSLTGPIKHEEQNWLCPYCDRKYLSSGKRREHIISKHPKELLPPSIRKGGREGANVNLVQTSQKSPHKCPYCPKEYAYRTKLLKHCKEKHQDKQVPYKYEKWKMRHQKEFTKLR